MKNELIQRNTSYWLVKIKQFAVEMFFLLYGRYDFCKYVRTLFLDVGYKNSKIFSRKWSNFNMSISQQVVNRDLLVGYGTQLASENLWQSEVRFANLRNSILSEIRRKEYFQWNSLYCNMKINQIAGESSLSCTYVTL